MSRTADERRHHTRRARHALTAKRDPQRDALSAAVPQSSRAQYDAGMIATDRADTAEAFTRRTAAAALQPADPRIAHELGVSYLREGEYERAIASLQRALELARTQRRSARCSMRCVGLWGMGERFVRKCRGQVRVDRLSVGHRYWHASTVSEMGRSVR